MAELGAPEAAPESSSLYRGGSSSESAGAPLLLTRQVQCLMACVPYFVPPGAGGGDRFLPQARLSWK